MIAEAEVRAEEADKVQARRPIGGTGRTQEARRLVLARQLGESIMIGDSVMVEVLGLKTNSVRLRIVAPRSVAVHRREVYDAIRLAPRPSRSRATRPARPRAPVGRPLPREGGLVLTRRTGRRS